MFNIGISGQMLFGGIFAVIIGQNFLGGMPMGVGQLIIILLGIVGGMFVAGLVGVLKAYLNVNEVVSSILFN
jgi:simple sugar transport system permease protein